MKATVGDMMDIMETLAPLSLAEDWDNAGLQIGHRDQPVNRVMVALDPSIEVVKSACQQNVDLLITHHPLIFKPLYAIDLNTPVGRIISLSVETKLSIFSAHTNLDIAHEGINDMLAEKLSLTDINLLEGGNESTRVKDGEKMTGLGRIGVLEDKMGLSELAESVKEKLGLKSLRVAGHQDLLVSNVAICCGSGSSLLGRFFSSNAQVFIAGDLRYHDAREVEALNLGLIDIGHFASEHLMLEVLVRKLDEKIKERELDVVADACTLEKEPFVIY